MKTFEMVPVIILSLFDGGAAGAAGAAGDGTGAPTGTEAGKETGEVKGGRENTRRGKSGEDLSNVQYGKQPPQANGDSNTADNEKNTVNNPAAEDTKAKSKEELKAEFQKLINGEYKDAYTEDTQRIIDRRFKSAKETKAQLEAQRVIINSMMDRYGITDGDIAKLTEAVNADDELLRRAAEEKGMDVSQFREYQQMKRENEAVKRAESARLGQERADRQIAEWEQQVAELRGTPENPGEYPNINLSDEVKNPAFLAMLRAHVPLKDAYEQVHKDEIRQKIAADAEKRLSESIRSNGMRPRENGSSSRSSFQSKQDPNSWSNADLDEVRKRVNRGEKVYL